MCASIQIFVIALLIQSGLAIKCFSCDSDSNPRCGNMTDPNLVALDCDYDRLMEQEQKELRNYNHRHWLLKASDFHGRILKNEVDVKLICQKLVGTDVNNHVTIVRRCQIANELPCNASRFSRNNAHVDCYLCDVDGCNGSTHNSVLGMLIAFASVVAVFKHLVF
ncbi:uncharacterized protein LOC119066480 isoform X1 [Bradysia coprophila]|uniref:uncharacterized protein LOC119066480 isoform X1 n=1 Tax=Bradysia coprophila TaxID=38358 RepID=UPI00187DD8AE|nr:uncharacterized protein LOC119066480 isoform X1 [Bradysia coprophila]